MAKADVVSAAVAAVQAGQLQVLNDQFSSVFDQAEAQGTGPGFTQADIDAAVKAAVDPLNAQIAAITAQDAADVAAGQQALTQLQAAKDALQAQFDTLSAKEGQEAGVITGLQGSLTQMQNVVAILQALAPLVMPPPPPPVPDVPAA